MHFAAIAYTLMLAPFRHALISSFYLLLLLTPCHRHVQRAAAARVFTPLVAD